MARPVTLFTGQWADLPLADLAARCGALGFDGLELAGLVSRTEDERDRRARIVALTPAGDAALAAALIVRAKVMDEIFGSLSAHDRTVLVDLLMSIRTNLPSGDSSCAR